MIMSRLIEKMKIQLLRCVFFAPYIFEDTVQLSGYIKYDKIRKELLTQVYLCLL